MVQWGQLDQLDGLDAMPEKFDAVLKAEYNALIAAGEGKSDAADIVGISRQTVKNHRESDPAFAEDERKAVEAARALRREGYISDEVFVRKGELALSQLIDEKHFPSVQFALTRRAKERWGDTPTNPTEANQEILAQAMNNWSNHERTPDSNPPAAEHRTHGQDA